MLRLSKRLAAISELVPHGANVIDVGTDHGLLPVWLVKNGVCEHIIASDIKSGPLTSAAKLVDYNGMRDKISLFIRDGLSGFSRSDGDCIVIAGMGGENIAAILKNAPWTKDAVRLILQPQSKSELLRLFLTENGYEIIKEKLVADNNRLYQVLCAVGGESMEYNQAELYLGLYDQIRKDPLLPAYLEDLLQRKKKAGQHDRDAAQLCEELDTWRKRISDN